MVHSNWFSKVTIGLIKKTKSIPTSHRLYNTHQHFSLLPVHISRQELMIYTVEIRILYIGEEKGSMMLYSWCAVDTKAERAADDGSESIWQEWRPDYEIVPFHTACTNDDNNNSNNSSNGTTTTTTLPLPPPPPLVDCRTGIAANREIIIILS